MAEFYASIYTLYVTSGGDAAIGVTLKFVHEMVSTNYF